MDLQYISRGRQLHLLQYLPIATHADGSSARPGTSHTHLISFSFVLPDP